MRPTLFSAAVLCLLPLGLFGQEILVTGAHAAQAALPVGEASWATGFDGAMKQPQVSHDLGLTVTQGPIKLVSLWSVVTTTGGTSVRNEEAYLAWNPDNFRLALGNQIFAWGTADGRNPTDTLNPRDYTSVAGQKIRKLPVFAADAVWYPSEAISLEAVAIPVAGTSLYPTDTADALRLPAGVKGAVAGGKFNFRSAEFDASISYLYDFDSLPSVTVDGGSVTLERRRVHRFGADWKTTVDRFGLWAEGAYTLTGNADGGDSTERRPRFDATTGLDFSYGPADAYYLNFQYSVVWVPGYEPNSSTELLYTLGGIEEELLNSLTVSAHWNLFADSVVPAVSGTYSFPVEYEGGNTRYGSLLLKPEVDFIPVESFHITVAAVLAYEYDSAGTMAVYEPQNNISITASYQWNAGVTP